MLGWSKYILIAVSLWVIQAAAWSNEAESPTSTVVQEPVVAKKVTFDDESPNISTTADHRVQIRLTGSTCAVCLHNLQLKLNKLTGVAKIKIDFPGNNLYEYMADPSMAWALATIDYDSKTISVSILADHLRQEGYHPFKIVDKPIR